MSRQPIGLPRSGQTGTMTGLVERLSTSFATITGTRGAKGIFLIYFDDDNYFLPGAISTIRMAVRHDMDALYLFKMEDPDGTVLKWIDPVVDEDNTDTACGVVPIRHAHLVNGWLDPDYYNADNTFMVEMSQVVPQTVFINAVTFVYTGGRFGNEDLETSQTRSLLIMQA